MEQKVFRSPAVAGPLQQHFVEARLHTDEPPPDPRTAELQRELARSVANPIFVVVDPRDERELGRWESGDPSGGSAFAAFLNGLVASRAAGSSR